MALKVSSYGSAGGLRHKIAHEDAVNASAEVDVFGTSGTIRSVEIWNQHSAIVYFKIKTTTGTYAAGSTDPDYQFSIPVTTNKRFDFPDGIPFTQLTFWCTASSAASATDAPGGTVAATFICS